MIFNSIFWGLMLLFAVYNFALSYLAKKENNDVLSYVFLFSAWCCLIVGFMAGNKIEIEENEQKLDILIEHISSTECECNAKD